MAALLSLLINKHGQKGDRNLDKCRAFPSVSKRREKAKEAEMSEKEVANKLRNIQVTILKWQRSPAETFPRNLYEDRKSKTCCDRRRSP